MSLNLQIRALRKEQGLTLETVAGRVGISVAHLSEVERGLKNVNNHLLERIASALGVQPVQLLGGAPAPVDGDTERFTEIFNALGAEDRARAGAFVEGLFRTSQGSKQT